MKVLPKAEAGEGALNVLVSCCILLRQHWQLLTFRALS